MGPLGWQKANKIVGKAYVGGRCWNSLAITLLDSADYCTLKLTLAKKLIHVIRSSRLTAQPYNKYYLLFNSRCPLNQWKSLKLTRFTAQGPKSKNLPSRSRARNLCTWLSSTCRTIGSCSGGSLSSAPMASHTWNAVNCSVKNVLCWKRKEGRCPLVDRRWP